MEGNALRNGLKNQTEEQIKVTTTGSDRILKTPGPISGQVEISGSYFL